MASARVVRGVGVAALVLGGALGAAAGCSLAIPFDSLTGGDASTPIDDGAPLDTTVPDEGGPACRRNCLGAPCVDDRCTPVDLATDQGSPQGLSIDANGEIFWTNQSPPGLYRLPKGGTRARIDEAGDNLANPWDIAADGTHYYWSEYIENSVFRRPRTGGAKQRVSSCTGQCAWIVVANDLVYATDYFANNPPNGNIASMPVAGGNSANAFPNQPLAAGLAVSNGVLFWVRGGQAGSIQAAPLGADAGTGAAGIGATVTGLAADGEDLYFISDERRIQHVRRGGTVIETLFETDTAFGPGDVALDPDAVYWTEPKTGRVRKTAR